MEYSSLAQLCGGAGIAYLIIRDVLRFVKEREIKRSGSTQQWHCNHCSDQEGQGRQLSAQWRKIDVLDDDLQKLEVRMIERFAIKSEVKEGLDRVGEDVKECRKAIEGLREDLRRPKT